MNIFQQSIARTRATMREYDRLRAIALRQIKENREKANANVELLLDEIVAETGIELKPENMPIIMVYVARFIEHQRRRREAMIEGDDEGMKDFSF
jgi:hypothetical protein